MLLGHVLSLCLAVAPPTVAPRAAAPDAEASYRAGLEALKAKDSEAASAALGGCVALAPERVDCRWELGWAHYLKGDWAKVVEAWEHVERLAPEHEGLAEHLADARAQLALQRRLAETGPAIAPERRAGPPGAVLRIRAVGDVMLGTDTPAGHLPPEDGAALLGDVKALLADADLTFINLEGPLCDIGKTNKCRKGGACYAFRTPTRYGRYLVEAGVDLASTANNHSGDFGEVCRRETERTLDALGIGWSGPPGSIATIERNGLRIAMVAFHASRSCNYLNDHDGARAIVARAAAEHDLVIVSFHGGAEGANALRVPVGSERFYGEDRGDLRAFTRAVVDAGADLVLGHGPHVVRGMELYKERLVVYSMGNFATYGRFSLGGALGIGVIVEADLDGQGRFLGGRLLPTRQLGKGVPVRDPEGAVIAQVRKLNREDFPEFGAQVDEDGRIEGVAEAIAATSEVAPKAASGAGDEVVSGTSESSEAAVEKGEGLDRPAGPGAGAP